MNSCGPTTLASHGNQGKGDVKIMDANRASASNARPVLNKHCKKESRQKIGSAMNCQAGQQRRLQQVSAHRSRSEVQPIEDKTNNKSQSLQTILEAKISPRPTYSLPKASKEEKRKRYSKALSQI